MGAENLLLHHGGGGGHPIQHGGGDAQGGGVALPADGGVLPGHQAHQPLEMLLIDDAGVLLLLQGAAAPEEAQLLFHLPQQRRLHPVVRQDVVGGDARSGRR